MGPLLVSISLLFYPILALVAVILLWRGVLALEKLARVSERFERGQAQDRHDRPHAS
jgi:hypothetical protein